MLCTGTFRVIGEICFWLQISVVLWDLMPMRPSLSSAATLENMLVVKHIKHVRCHFCIYKARFFSFLFICFFKRCYLKIGRGQSVLFRYLLSFFHSSPAAGSSCMPAAHTHEPHDLGTSPCPGVHLCISAQGWCLPGFRDDAQVWVPEGLTLCTGCLLTTAAGKNTSSTDNSQKVL